MGVASTVSDVKKNIGGLKGFTDMKMPVKAAMILPGITTGLDAVSRISEGEAVIPSIAKAAGSALVQEAAFALLGPVGSAIAIGGTIAYAAGSFAIENGKNNTQQLANLRNGSEVINSKNAQTMRQRGMSMINQNGEVTRSVFGSEARAYMRNYHSV